MAPSRPKRGLSFLSSIFLLPLLAVPVDGSSSRVIEKRYVPISTSISRDGGRVMFAVYRVGPRATGWPRGARIDAYENGEWTRYGSVDARGFTTAEAPPARFYPGPPSPRKRHPVGPPLLSRTELMVVDVPGPISAEKVRVDLSGSGRDVFEFVVDESVRPDFPASLPQFVAGLALDDRSRDCTAIPKRLAASASSSTAIVERWATNQWAETATGTIRSLIKGRTTWCDKTTPGTLIRVGTPEKGWFYLLGGRTNDS